jgi:hypothetical protein
MRRKEQSSDCSGDAKRMSHVTSSEIAALRRAKYIRRRQRTRPPNDSTP